MIKIHAGFRTLVRLPLVMLVVSMIAGCADPHRNHVESLIQSSLPDGLIVKSIDSRYVLTKSPDGSRQAVVPVYFEARDDRFLAQRWFSTPRGKLLAQSIDAVSSWATNELRPDDPTRAEMLGVRSEIPFELLILTRTVSAQDEIAALVEISWPPNTPPSSGQIRSGLPEISGHPMADPSVGLEAGSEAARMAMESIQARVRRMESLQTQWKETRDTRDARDRAQWTSRFVRGAVFQNDTYRMVVVQDFSGPGAKPEWILTTRATPVTTVKMSGSWQQIYGGGLELRTISTHEIFTHPDPARVSMHRSLADAPFDTLVFKSPDTLTATRNDGSTISMAFDQVVDLLPLSAE